jgi:hypothetical protein
MFDGLYPSLHTPQTIVSLENLEVSIKVSTSFLEGSAMVNKEVGDVGQRGTELEEGGGCHDPWGDVIG